MSNKNLRLDPRADAELLSRVKSRNGQSLAELYSEAMKSKPVPSRTAGAKRTKVKRVVPEFVRTDHVVKITLAYPPSTNNAYVNTKNGRMLTNEAKAYKQLARAEALRQSKGFKFTGEVCLTMHVYRPQRSRDLSNCIKLAEDSLKGICVYDDEQVCELNMKRSLDRASPRVEIELRQVHS